MRAYKVTLLVIDFENINEDCICEEIANVNYPNDCIRPQILNCEGVDIGEWTDDHPLNQSETFNEEVNKLFP